MSTTVTSITMTTPAFVFPLHHSLSPKESSPALPRAFPPSTTTTTNTSTGHARHTSVASLSASAPTTVFPPPTQRPALQHPNPQHLEQNRLSLPPSSSSSMQASKPRSPARKHAHRRSAAISHDFLADLRLEQQKQQVDASATPLPPSPTPSRAESPCRSPSLSLGSSSTSLASVSSASTTPPSRAKVMFSPAIEFIPSHSCTTSTSTTATITPSQQQPSANESPELLAAKPSADAEITRVSPLPVSPSKRASVVSTTSTASAPAATTTYKKGKSWSFIRFRRKTDGLSLSPPPTEEEDEGEEDEDEEDEDEDLPVPRPATPPHVSHAPRATHYFTRSGTPEPVIDLDAALGPAGTPSLLSGTWTTSSFHRRTESAPGMINGTKSVDFRTFSQSMSLALDGPRRSSSSSSGMSAVGRGMKRKMSAVAEIAEERDESAIDSEDNNSSSDEAQENSSSTAESQSVETKVERRSVWEDFVSSFNAASQNYNSSSASYNSSKTYDSQRLGAKLESVEGNETTVDTRDDVLIVDEFGEAIVLGEPGPEIRHSVIDSGANSLHNSGSTSTLSEQDMLSVSAPATESPTKRQESERGGWHFRKRSHDRRKSLVVGLKNAMMKSQSVGNLLHNNSTVNLSAGSREEVRNNSSNTAAAATSPSKSNKLHRRRPSKQDAAMYWQQQQQQLQRQTKSIGGSQQGWRSHGDLPVANTEPIVGTRRHAKHASVTTTTSSTLRAGTMKNLSNGKSKNVAGRMWDWVRGIIAV
ncbi:hypothetical protein BZA70DRAFT_9906 [Myxozyma melibiosi]|uniref:Uncharacterized protein n=1 Tax=Myxozyma melibiosi TaxID=54550 RepID=A0ABR1FBU2_9ASCO